MLNLDADMGTFFEPSEFADLASIQDKTGAVLAPIVSGIASTHIEITRPADNNGSGFSAFQAGKADFNLQAVQFLTAWAVVAAVPVDSVLLIGTGRYAGRWRIRTIERDGDIARLKLNVTK